MAFINDYLPLPTKPLINSTFTYKTNVLTNSEWKEQRIPMNSEYRLQIDLSDVTFTETELTTFITFYQTNLKGKLNTFKLRHPFENTTTTDPFQLDEAGTMFSYGRAIYVGVDDAIPGNHLYRVFKVYEYRDGTDVYRAFKTIGAIDTTETITVFDSAGTLPLGGTVTADGTGVVSVNALFFADPQAGTSNLLQVACTYDHVMRLDVDAIPQISLALRPIGVTTGCDHYQFESLNLVEEINERVDPYIAVSPSTVIPIPTSGDNLVIGSGLTNSIFQVIIPREFDLPLRPIETIEYKFDTKVVSINDFEYRDSYSDEDNRWRGVFDSTRVRQERAQEIAAFFFIAKGRLHRFTVNFRNVPTQTGRFDQDSITFNHLVAASEANYHLFPTNVTQKSLYDLQSLEFIAALGVDPIDLTDDNEIACTTGTATYVLTFTDIDTAINYEGAFYTDIKYLSVEQSSLTTLDVPLFTVAQNVSGTIEISEGGYGTDVLVQREVKTLINGRLGIDTNDLVGVATNKLYMMLATDGDVEVYLKSDLTTPILAATAEEIYDLDGDPDLAAAARITKIGTSGRGELIVTAISSLEIAAAGANTTDLNFFGIGKQNVSSTQAVFTQLEITENQSVFFAPTTERLRYSENNDFSGVNLALTPTGAGDFAIAHDVIDFNLQSNLSAVIAGNAAPENGLTMAEIFPVSVLVNTRGINQDVLNASSLAGFNHTRRILNIQNLFFPQDGVVATSFSQTDGFLDYETLIDPDSPLQPADMTTREFYGGTIGGNGVAYTWRAGNASPVAPYAVGTDFELTQITGTIKLVKDPIDPYTLPPFTVPVTPINIDPDDLTPTQITDNGGFYSGGTGGGASGTGGTAGAGGEANIAGFTMNAMIDQLPPDSISPTFWQPQLILSSPVTGIVFVLATTTNVASPYRNRFIVYRLTISGSSWVLTYDAVASALTREYIVTSFVRPDFYRHANGDTAMYMRCANVSFVSPYAPLETGLLRFATDDSGNFSVTYTDDTEVNTAILAGAQLNRPFFATENRIYFAANIESNVDTLLTTKNGIEYRTGFSNSTGIPFNFPGNGTYDDGEVSLWRDNADFPLPDQKSIRFADSANVVVTFDDFSATSIDVTRGPNVHGCDGSYSGFASASVCDDPGVGVCNIAQEDVAFQILREDNTLSAATAEPVLNSTFLFIGSIFTGDGAYPTTSESNIVGRRCDKLGNLCITTGTEVFYAHSKAGVTLNITSLKPTGSIRGQVVVTTWGFLVMTTPSPANMTSGVNFGFIQPIISTI